MWKYGHISAATVAFLDDAGVTWRLKRPPKPFLSIRHIQYIVVTLLQSSNALRRRGAFTSSSLQMYAVASSASAASSIRVRVRAPERRPRASFAVAGTDDTLETKHHLRGSAKTPSGGGEGRRGALAKLTFGFAAGMTSAGGAAGPASANVKYANDCDPICHILDDGGAKSQAMEAAMKKDGPDMGSAMEQLIAQRKAEEKAAAAAAAGAKGEGKPRGF